MNKKVIKLTESDLRRIVEESVERAVDEGFMKDLAKTAGMGAIGAAGALATMATDNPVSRNIDRQFSDRAEMRRAFPEDRDEFGNKLKPQERTISWDRANEIPESIISRAVMESVKKILTEGEKWIGDYERNNFDILRQKVSECGGTCSFSLNGKDFTMVPTQRGFTITSGVDFGYESFGIDSALKAAWKFSNGVK